MVDGDRRPHALYRLYRADGVLLYVGVTMSPFQRFKAHSAKQPSWAEVATITLERFADRPSVLEAERVAIATEHPLVNVIQPREAPPPLPSPDEPGLSPGERLRRARKCRGLSRVALCGQAQVPKLKTAHLAAYELGRRIPPDHARALGQFLGVDLRGATAETKR